MNFVSIAVGFALLSMLFGGLVDVSFKLYSRKERSRGMYVFFIGIVWGILQLTTLELQGQSIATDKYTIMFGLVAGVMITISNLLLIESFTHLDVGVGSTIYRLNTIGVVILAFLFLAEPLGVIKLSGIGCGIIAALFLYQHRHESLDPQVLRLFFWMAVTASLMRAAFGVTTKAGLSEGANGSTMMLIAAGCWVIGGFSYALLREHRVRVTREKLFYSTISGVLVFLTANTLILGLEYGDASIVVPIANLSFVVSLGISLVLKMEMFTARKGVAIMFASLSIILLTYIT